MVKGKSAGADEVELVVTDEKGKVKKITHVSSFGQSFKSAAKNIHFCPDCGEPLTEIPLFICNVCGQRYVARVEPKTGKTIIFAIGKPEAK